MFIRVSSSFYRILSKMDNKLVATKTSKTIATLKKKIELLLFSLC